MFQSVMDYASPVFINPGKTLDLKLYRIYKRAFYIIHGREVKECTRCNILDFGNRRAALAMRIFMNAKNDSEHILNDLIPSSSDFSDRILLPYVKSARRLNGFIFQCTKLYNESL